MAPMPRPATASPRPELVVLDRFTQPSDAAGGSVVIVAPLTEWARAVRRGNPTEAAYYRHLLDTHDGDPTWEDAEWL